MAWNDSKWSPFMRRCLHKAALLRERGGLPAKPGEPPREAERRVRELRWQMERFAEIIDWESETAAAIIEGTGLFHYNIMVMRHETGQYDVQDGDDLYEVDKWVQQRLDPTVDVGRA